ncbi:MAG: cysteine--tRNA ligase [Nitrososphaerales archaeon]
MYNTLTGKKEEFQPRESGVVKMFVCGPTVYDSIHLGHARTYLVYDVLARYLKMKGFILHFIVNITDLDDKVFERAEEEGVEFEALAERYTQEFIECLKSLKIFSIDAFLKASEYLDEMESQIEQLVKKGHAYQVDGDVYFDTSTFPDYGKLSHQTPAELKLRRLDPDPKKRDQRDFQLWRSWIGSPPSFPSRFGRGRPGWHIEDTAISISTLGSGYDIHGGAVELVFPHHEAEIAQAESLTGRRPFVKYWVHTGLLVLEGEKMSKSLGNIITLRDALGRWDPDVLRLCLLSRHYRKMFDFEVSGTKGSEDMVALIRRTVSRLKRRVESGEGEGGHLRVEGRFQRHIDSFFRALDDDLDTPKALDALMMLIKELNKDVNRVDQDLLNTVLTMVSIMGLEPSSGE